ncbi:MAG: hypothetical protein AAFV93_18265, partial [Chloroflexota bacterium]
KASTSATDDVPIADLTGVSENGRALVHLAAHFKRGDEPKRDRLRLRRIHAVFMTYPGEDTFSIVIQGRGKPTVMDFPNHTTGMCEALLKDLRDIVGDDGIHIKEKV